MSAGADPRRIRYLGQSLGYLDGAEDRVREVLSQAEDRSPVSDELAAHIVDWPTRYHFSRHRANLLRPFAIGAAMRVLEIGAGTGSLSRFLGETGAEVVSLEGSPARAHATAARCRDLGNVEVVCGPLEQLEDDRGFDLVVVVGVLEYAAAAIGGGAGPDVFLTRCAQLLAPAGALVLAIENQLGLKYLLGYCEDHVGQPWVGVEDYPGRSTVRTFSRRQLESHLGLAGFSSFRWFFPFPDYKLPEVILAEPAYRLQDAARFVDQQVRQPVRDLAYPRTRLCNERLAHRLLVAEGLGPAVANSLLVVAARGEADLDDVVDPAVVAWRFGGHRLSRWMRHQRVSVTPSGLTVAARAAGVVGAERASAWLRQDPTSLQPYFPGATLEQLFLDSVARHDDGAAALGAWRSFVDAHAQISSPGSGGENPFLAGSGDQVLPETFLDLCLANFVVSPTGTRLVDQEWRASGGVARDLVMTRALWYLAHDLVLEGLPHPWSASPTIDDLVRICGGLCGLEVSGATYRAFHRAEAQLQAMVSGARPDDVLRDLESTGRLSRHADTVMTRVPVTTLHRQLGENAAELAAERAQAAALRSEIEALRHEQAHLTDELARLRRHGREPVTET